MKTLGVRELKAHISEVLRQVQEGEVIEVTNHGEVVARLVPVRPARNGNSAPDAAIWTDLDRLAAEIGKYLPDRVDAVEAITDVRREL